MPFSAHRNRGFRIECFPRYSEGFLPILGVKIVGALSASESQAKRAKIDWTAISHSPLLQRGTEKAKRGDALQLQNASAISEGRICWKLEVGRLCSEEA
jgi:hypothetical protein